MKMKKKEIRAKKKTVKSNLSFLVKFCLKNRLFLEKSEK